MHIVGMLGRSVWRNVQADGDATRRFHTRKFDGIGEEILVNYVQIDATMTWLQYSQSELA